VAATTPDLVNSPFTPKYICHPDKPHDIPKHHRRRS
jgi:hypothetical protein